MTNDKILIVEDELIVANDLQLTLKRAGHSVCGIASSVPKAMELVRQEKPWLVFIDILLKGNLTGIDLASELNQLDIAFIYLSANSSSQILQLAKVTQPYGFIVKPFRAKDILVTLDIARYRYEQHRRIKEQAGFPDPHDSGQPASAPVDRTDVPAYPDGTYEFEGIVGKSPRMMEVFELIRQVSPLDTSVLITGETGSGKEGIADCIHRLSPRRTKPFIKVNCATLPVNLIESELFGHEKGSFTGAFDKRIGKFEAAAGGTIFLDEIGEMPVDMQVKLLRVLQEKEIERIGGRGFIKVDVRVIAATNRNLEKEIEVGKFRLDLYYRLHVFPISLPSLRERVQDIPLLVSHFIDMYAQKTGKPVKGISQPALRALLQYSWPGNVRELQHLVERSVLLCREEILKEIPLPNQPFAAPPAGSILSDRSVKTIDELERDHILAVLAKCNNRISGPGGAAALLNLPPSTLSSKMKKLGIVKRHMG